MVELARAAHGNEVGLHHVTMGFAGGTLHEMITPSRLASRSILLLSHPPNVFSNARLPPAAFVRALSLTGYTSAAPPNARHENCDSRLLGVLSPRRRFNKPPSPSSAALLV
jgi:hypothetical protein